MGLPRSTHGLVTERGGGAPPWREDLGGMWARYADKVVPNPLPPRRPKLRLVK
jgi:hypothetical protein